MRITEQTAKRFRGTHKGCDIAIDLDEDTDEDEFGHGLFYIRVNVHEGGYLYDGWAPESVTTIEEAKREALAGACLDRPGRKRR
jgi:hypothetical protein